MKVRELDKLIGHINTTLDAVNSGIRPVRLEAMRDRLVKIQTALLADDREEVAYHISAARTAPMGPRGQEVRRYMDNILKTIERQL